MDAECPHCGVTLPEYRDAFCPECRQSLIEIPIRQAKLAPITIAMSDIAGAENLSVDDLIAEVGRGGKLVLYHYCVSVLVLTMLRPSRVHLVRAEESTVAKGLPYTLLSLIAGWWGLPWGLIHTPYAVSRNFAGGTDVTAALLQHLAAQSIGNGDWEDERPRHSASDAIQEMKQPPDRL